VDAIAAGSSIVQQYENKLRPVLEKAGFRALLLYMRDSLSATM